MRSPWQVYVSEVSAGVRADFAVLGGTYRVLYREELERLRQKARIVALPKACAQGPRRRPLTDPQRQARTAAERERLANAWTQRPYYSTYGDNMVALLSGAVARGSLAEDAVADASRAARLAGELARHRTRE